MESINQSQLERLQFVEDLLVWTGRVGNQALRKRFRVSKAQAAQDIARYRKLQTAKVLYEPALKSFVAPDDLEPLFAHQSFERFLSLAQKDDLVDQDVIDIAVLYPPARSVPIRIARSVAIACVSGREIEVDYVSISSGISRRWIVPHAFASDGLRAHVRAFDHKRESFGDFVMGRIKAVRGDRAATVDVGDDRDWFETSTIELIPNPALSEHQQEIVRAEYRFNGLSLTHSVRRAMLLYMNSRLFLHSNLAGMPNEHLYRQLVPRNQEQYDHLIDSLSSR